MQTERIRPPGGGPGKSLAGGNSGNANYTIPAPVRAFRQELGIILNAAHRMAAGYVLLWSDYDRLHEAHQHVIKVLEVLHD